MKQDSIIYYRSFREALRELPAEMYRDVSEMIFDYAFDDIEPPEGASPVARAFFKSFKPTIDSYKKRYENCVKNGRKGAEHGKKGGNPNFKKGQTNPYYQKDNPQDNPKDNPQDNPLYKEYEIRNKKEEITPKGVLPEKKAAKAAGEHAIGLRECNQIRDLWNETVSNLPQIMKITAGNSRSNRKGAMEKCVKFITSELTQNHTFDEALLVLNKVFTKANSSDFLTGHGGREWKASFDWVIKPERVLQILEGNFDNSTTTKDAGKQCNKEWQKAEKEEW